MRVAEYKNITDLRLYNESKYNRILTRYIQMRQLYNRNLEIHKLSINQELRLINALSKAELVLGNMSRSFKWKLK